MSVHPAGCDCGSYACELRNKGVQISPAATPSSRNNVPGDNARYNSYEKGVATEKRPGGAEMPILNSDGQTIPIKTFNEKHRHKYQQTRRKREASKNT